MNKRILFFLLIIGCTIFGFAFQLDLTQRWGCLVFAETYLIPYRVSFFTVSMAILTTCLFLTNEQLQLKLLGIELGLWIIVFFLVKGGYAVGFGGIPDQAIMSYDLMALSLRLFNLSFYFQDLNFINGAGKRMLIIAAISITLIVIKANEFSLPIIYLP